MKIHVTTPFAVDKRLGRAYNEEFEKVAEDDWVCLRDHDTLFLLPDTINHLYGYVQRYQDAGMFTCFSNRNHPTMAHQLLGGKMSENTDIRYHIELAESQKSYLYKATEIKGNISGMLMLISKQTWNKIKFAPLLKCLGVDFEYCRTLRNNRKRILRMDGVYIWHTYRLNDINDKKHLI